MADLLPESIPWALCCSLNKDSPQRATSCLTWVVYMTDFMQGCLRLFLSQAPHPPSYPPFTATVGQLYHGPNSFFNPAGLRENTFPRHMGTPLPFLKDHCPVIYRDISVTASRSSGLGGDITANNSTTVVVRSLLAHFWNRLPPRTVHSVFRWQPWLGHNS